MTFEKLHKGIKSKCKCLEIGPATENYTDTFARRVKNDPVQLSDFLSYRELGIKVPVDRNDDCPTLCKFRGLSVNKVTETDEQKLKEDWADKVRTKPKQAEKIGRMYCKFRLKDEAGMVWHTPSNENESHYTFLRDDEFALEHLEIVELSSLE